MPEFLVVPAGKEGRQYGIHAGARDKQMGEVQRNVVLDVHHVMETEEVSLGKRVRGDILPRRCLRCRAFLTPLCIARC